jgi:cytidylate kinase
VKKGFIIAIDGPTASGKGTIAKKLAKVFKGLDLNTGSMYRCLALFCINNEITIDNPSEVIAQLENVHIAYRDDRVELNGLDVTDAIQDTVIAQGASIIGVIPQVRKNLVQRQQAIGLEAVEQGEVVVAEGRDTGTAVFPDAVLKIYLTATDQVRAKRRLAQNYKNGDKITYDKMLEEVKVRDQRDMQRNADPLTGNPEKLGYIVLDNSDLNEEQTINEIITRLKRRKLFND